MKSDAYPLDPSPRGLPVSELFKTILEANADPIAADDPHYPVPRDALTPELANRAATTRANAAAQEAEATRLLTPEEAGQLYLIRKAEADRLGYSTVAEYLEVVDPVSDRRAEASADPDDLPTVYTVGALAELPSADELYIIGDGILTVGGKLLLYAKSGAGKTTLLDFLAGPLSTGRPFLGRYPVDRPLRVLIVQG